MANNSKTLTANNLKNVLWDTLNGVKAGTIDVGQADAIASQAREIIRTTKVQIQICQVAKRQVPADVLNFSESAAL